MIFSHSNPSRLAPNPRNIDDEQIKACVGRGGIVGLVSWGPLVMAQGQQDWPTLAQFVGIIDDVAQLTGGTAHIGIGTDMSLGTYPDHRADPWGEADYPNISAEYGRRVTADIRSPRRSLDGFSDYPEVVNLANALLARGYTEAQVSGILGENYLRLFAAVWRDVSRREAARLRLAGGRLRCALAGEAARYRSPGGRASSREGVTSSQPARSADSARMSLPARERRPPANAVSGLPVSESEPAPREA